MLTTICTLFEGDYHYGVAALTNSLYKCGFRGKIYAGYRGELPKWSTKAIKHEVGKWENASVLSVAEGLQLVFIPLTTDYHLTNYKPDFMLELLDGPANDSDAIFYFDPDICVVESWTFFEEWVSCGVALCEDVNSPLPENHPRRMGWRRYFSKYNFNLKFRAPEYVNGGFVGLNAANIEFLSTWKKTMSLMAHEIGTLAASKLTSGQKYKSKGFAYCFDASDQDALNAAIEASDLTISIIGQEAMGFKNGAAVVPHALGPGKPWQRSYLRKAFSGHPPRLIDKVFWNNISEPITASNNGWVNFKKMEVYFASALGRIWRRS